MIDTLGLLIYTEVEPIEMPAPWRISIRQRKNLEGFDWYYTYAVSLNAASVHLEYHRRSWRNGSPVIIVYISSIPKLICGNNYTLVNDTELIALVLNELLESVPGLPTGLDCASALLYCLHLCYQHPVGDLCPEYLQAIRARFYPHRVRRPYKNPGRHGFDNGVEFYSKMKKSVFYDKLIETRAKGHRGKPLRQEVQLRKAWSIRKVLGVQQPCLLDVSPERVASILQQDLKVLQLNVPILGEEQAYVQLCHVYGQKKGNDLNDLLVFLRKHPGLSKKEISDKRGIAKRTVDHQLQEMREAGVAPTDGEMPTILPGLSIDVAELGKPLLKVAGDTTDRAASSLPAEVHRRGRQLRRFPLLTDWKADDQRVDNWLGRFLAHRRSPTLPQAAFSLAGSPDSGEGH